MGRVEILKENIVQKKNETELLIQVLLYSKPMLSKVYLKVKFRFKVPTSIKAEYKNFFLD